MYWGRWRRDQAAGKEYLSVEDGWHVSWQRRVVTRRWESCREEVPWMSHYFSAAVWLSLAIAAVPRTALTSTVADAEP